MYRSKNLPYATITLAAINFLIYVAMLLLKSRQHFLALGAVYPAAILAGEYYRLLTAAFLHFDETHLMNNLLMICILGERVERLVGRAKLVLIYLLCAVGANVASVGWYLLTEPEALSAGASGAAMGLSGALLALLWKRRRMDGGVDRRGMLIVIGISLLGGFGMSNVNNMAHISGILIGWILGVILR